MWWLEVLYGSVALSHPQEPGSPGLGVEMGSVLGSGKVASSREMGLVPQPELQPCPIKKLNYGAGAKRECSERDNWHLH